MRESARRRAPNAPGITKRERLRLIAMAAGFFVLLTIFLLLWL